MKFMSILLREGRKEDLKKKYSDKFDEKTLDWILGISDLVDFNHKYTDFVLRVINPEIDASAEFVELIIDYLKLFDKNQSQLEKKDINQYKDFVELESALSPFKEKEKEKELEKQVDKIYEDNKFLVIAPKTHQASCKYGANTKWCTTAQSPDHFQRYTSGKQALYYIINKANSKNENYSKVAIHFDNSGNEKFWDSKDSPMSIREIEVFKYAFPEIIEKIEEDYKEKSVSEFDLFLKDVFNWHGTENLTMNNYLNSDSTVNLYVEGFNHVEANFNHAEGGLSIFLDGWRIDDYRIFISYSPDYFGVNPDYVKTFKISVGFMGQDQDDNDHFVDTDLEGWGFDKIMRIENTTFETSSKIRLRILNEVFHRLDKTEVLKNKVKGSKPVWRPDRIGYGYTFAQNKGLIKKLVDWLGASKIGTKLDFLVDIGKLDKKLVNNRYVYAQKGSNDFSPSVNWRGHFASFFASAKMAGILNYRKVGTQYYLVKGPNYDAFVQGELKAL